MEACLAELDELELYLSTLEKLMFPYQFGEYNICILPRSFPYGGMENPIFTFASPSIITGDKSGTSVAVHEMAHSWTGNLISCKNWENFWMNEGFTVYFENAALRELNGEEFYQVNSLVEQKMLLKTIDQFGKEDPYSAMAPVLNHANPDDAYSIIPYYKGHLFLTYLEGLLGRKPFLEMPNGLNSKANLMVMSKKKE
jgi:leukotriene-A4 hydrolase